MFDSFHLRLTSFIQDRNWEQYHHVKNLSMSLVCEGAELLECFCFPKQFDKTSILEELGDCFICLFSLYRILNFKIENHLSKIPSLEEQAYNEIIQQFQKPVTPAFLSQVFLVKATFIQERFLWVDEQSCKNYSMDLPENSLINPFKILLSVCHIYNVSALEVMNKKLSITEKKYHLGIAKDDSFLRKLNAGKIQKREKKC